MQTIYVIGDSTVENGNDPYYGWGGQIAAFLPGAQVDNHAFSGRSTKSFWDEGRFVPVAEGMKTGDLLLIGFGHNDEKDDAERHTDPLTTFPEMLMRYISAARLTDAVPVLCTSVSRNFFTGDGSLMYTHGEYPHAMRSLAEKERIPLIDLEMLTRELLKTLGAERACELYVNIPAGTDSRFPDGVADKTHFNIHGAQTVAKMVADALKKQGLVGE